MDSRRGSCIWHLKIVRGYERDSRVVPVLLWRSSVAPDDDGGGAVCARECAGRVRERSTRGRDRDTEGGPEGRILSVNRNDNLAIDPLRERASWANSGRRASRGSRVTTTRSGQSGTLLYCSPDYAELQERVPAAFALPRMPGDDGLGEPRTTSKSWDGVTALSVLITAFFVSRWSTIRR